MKSKAARKLLWVTTLASAIAASGSNALADTALNIYGYPSGTAATYDNASGAYPVITAVLSQPGTLDGYTYTAWSIIAADSTGSLDIFGVIPNMSFTPAPGQAISFTGTYSPYHQIPEINTNANGSSSISLFSSGHSVSALTNYTIPQLTNSGTGAIPQYIAGHLVTLDNVSLYTDSGATIPVSGNFATHANTTLYAKDGSGNIMEVYVWASSYYTDGALGGTPIPTGLVDITGFVSQSGTFLPEITPYSITQIPEPAGLAVFAVGGVLLTLVLRRRSV